MGENCDTDQSYRKSRQSIYGVVSIVYGIIRKSLGKRIEY